MPTHLDPASRTVLSRQALGLARRTLGAALVSAGLAWTAPSSVEATPVLVGSTEEFDVYVDDRTIERVRGLVSYRKIIDFRGAPREIASHRIEEQYDCERNATRFVSIVSHASPMGEGDAIRFGSLQADWVTVRPGTVADLAGRYACTGRLPY